MTKRVLILGPGGPFAANVLDTALAMGLDVTVAADVLPPRYQTCVDLVQISPFSPQFIEVIMAYCQDHHIDGVLTTSEYLVEPAAAICQRLALPGPSPEAAGLTRNKYFMRSRLREHGVPVPRFCQPASLADALQFARTVGYPVVLKPVHGTGSIGVHEAHSDDQLAQGWERLAGRRLHGLPLNASTIRAVLLEEYLTGDEFTLEFTVYNGESHCVGSTQTCISEEGYCLKLGSRSPGLQGADLQTAIAYVQRAIAAMHLDNTVCHGEIRLTGAGPRLLEIAGRPAGQPIPTVVEQCYGYSLAEAAVLIALGEKPPAPCPPRRGAAGIGIMPPTAGTLRRLAPGVPEGVPPQEYRHVFYAKAGEACVPPPASTDWLGFISAVGETPAEADLRARTAREQLDLVITSTSRSLQ